MVSVCVCVCLCLCLCVSVLAKGGDRSCGRRHQWSRRSFPARSYCALRYADAEHRVCQVVEEDGVVEDNRNSPFWGLQYLRANRHIHRHTDTQSHVVGCDWRLQFWLRVVRVIISVCVPRENIPSMAFLVLTTRWQIAYARCSTLWTPIWRNETTKAESPSRTCTRSSRTTDPKRRRRMPAITSSRWTGPSLCARTHELTS